MCDELKRHSWKPMVLWERRHFIKCFGMLEGTEQSWLKSESKILMLFRLTGAQPPCALCCTDTRLTSRDPASWTASARPLRVLVGCLIKSEKIILRISSYSNSFCWQSEHDVCVGSFEVDFGEASRSERFEFSEGKLRNLEACFKLRAENFAARVFVENSHLSVFKYLMDNLRDKSGHAW